MFDLPMNDLSGGGARDQPLFMRADEVLTWLAIASTRVSGMVGSRDILAQDLIEDGKARCGI